MKTLHIPFLMLCLLLLKTEAASAQNDTSYQLQVFNERDEVVKTLNLTKKVRIKMQNGSKYKGTFVLQDEGWIIENKTIDLDSIKYIKGKIFVDQGTKTVGVFVTVIGVGAAVVLGAGSYLLANYSGAYGPVFGVLGTIPGILIMRGGIAISSGQRKFRTEKWELLVIEHLEQPLFDTKTKQ